MTELFRRSWSVQVGTVLVQPEDGERPLTVRFEVSRSLEREPNTASIKLANLRPERRRALEQLDEPQLELRAGYAGDGLLDTIFVGDCRSIRSKREGPDVWTTIDAEDGGRSYRTATIRTSYPGNTSLRTILSDCAAAMGVGRGNLEQLVGEAELPSGAAAYSHGAVAYGQAWQVLDRFCRGAGLCWSVQAGVLQFRRPGQPAETRALRLSPSSGLVGSPERAKPDERTGAVKCGCQALLIPGLYPGRVVVLDSSEVTGNWTVRKVRYHGDSTGQEWYADLELEEY